jgi:hypothetical protein
MGLGAFLAYLLADLKLSEHPNHSGPESQADEQSSNGRPCGPPGDVFKDSEKREALVHSPKKSQKIKHALASIAFFGIGAFKR